MTVLVTMLLRGSMFGSVLHIIVLIKIGVYVFKLLSLLMCCCLNF